MKKEILEVFEIIEKELENEYQSRLCQKNNKVKEKAFSFEIDRLAGICMGIKNDAIYRVQQIKQQFPFKLKIFRREKEQKKLCSDCKDFSCEDKHKCKKWKEIYNKMWKDE